MAASRWDKMGIVIRYRDGLSQQCRCLLAPALGQGQVGAVAERSDVRIRLRDALTDRVVGGQSVGQPLRFPQPSHGQLFLDLLAQEFGGVRGQQGGGYEPGLVRVQAERLRLPGESLLDEALFRERSQLLNDFRQQQVVQIALGAGGGPQYGQHVFAWWPGRVAERQRTDPGSGRRDRVFIQPSSIREPETAEDLESVGDGAPNTTEADSFW